MTKKVPLSFNKFKELTEKYNFKIIEIYVQESHVIFIQIESLYNNKIFFIHVPAKYKMIYKAQNATHIKPSILENVHQKKFLESMNNGDVQLLALTSSYMCFGGKQFYEFGEIIKETKENDVHEFEKQLRKIKNQLGVDEKVKFEKKNQTKKDLKIVFKDAEGDPIDGDIKKMVIAASNKTKKVNLDSQNTIEIVVSDDEDEKEPDNAYSIAYNVGLENVETNYVPRLLERLKTNIGAIFVCEEINKFFKNVSAFDDKLVELYNKLYEKESEMRRSKILEIEKNITEIKENLTKELEEIEKRETYVKEQIKKLSNVLISCEKMIKYKKNDEKLVALRNKTSEALDNFNMEMISLRDRSNNLVEGVYAKMEFLKKN